MLAQREIGPNLPEIFYTGLQMRRSYCFPAETIA